MDETDLRCKRTKQFLLNAMVSLLEEKSLDELSVADICEKAMVHRTTFYKHFGDKYDLFEYLIRAAENYVFGQENINEYKTPLDYYMKLLALAMNFVGERREQINKIIQSNNDDMVRDLLFGTLEREFATMLKDNKHDLKVPEKIVSQFYVNGIVSVVIWWITSNSKYSAKDILEYIKNLITKKI